MELLAVLCAVAALFFFCAVLTLKLHIPASAAPLTALGCLAAVLTLAGIANLLYPTMWVLYLLCLAGGVWALWRGGADGLRHRAVLPRHRAVLGGGAGLCGVLFCAAAAVHRL